MPERLPHVPEAEAAVLGAVLLPDPDRPVLPRILSLVKPEDFYSERHRLILAAMVRAHGQGAPVDLVTLSAALRETGDLDRAGGEAYLTKLADDAVTAANVEHHARAVADHAIRRRLMNGARELATLARTTPDIPTLAERARTLLDSILPLKGGIGKGTNFAPLSAADLLAEEAEPIPWVWEYYLPRGSLALLVSFMKVGKSTLAYPLALAVARGRPFLGLPTKQGPVLILAVEEHPRDVKRRLQRFGMQPGDPIYVHRGRLDNTPGTLKALQDFIVAKGITLVILDTLPSFWSITDENNNPEVVRQVFPLLGLARETGAAVLLLHHERKSGGEGGRAIRGGSALFALVDQALLLEPRQGGTGAQRTLRAIGRYDETPAELVIELVGNEYRKVGTAEELDPEAHKAKVWAALSTDAPKTLATLATATALTDKQVRQALGAFGDQVARAEKGTKGSPYTYRRAPSDSFLSQPHPIGEKTSFGAEAGTLVEAVSLPNDGSGGPLPLDEVDPWDHR